jgi:hypothetical protein
MPARAVREAKGTTTAHARHARLRLAALGQLPGAARAARAPAKQRIGLERRVRRALVVRGEVGGRRVALHVRVRHGRPADGARKPHNAG